MQHYGVNYTVNFIFTQEIQIKKGSFPFFQRQKRKRKNSTCMKINSFDIFKIEQEEAKVLNFCGLMC